MLSPKNIIVIGGNAAGPAAAAKAKRIAPDSNVIMFEKGNFISTGTCELPYLISGEIKNYNDLIFFTPDSFYKEKGVKVFTNHLVENIDRNKKFVTARNLLSGQHQEFNYDKLILATGSIPKTLPHISNNIQNAFTLKSVSDFLAIKNYCEKHLVKKVLVIGSGYIGIETADSFAKLGLTVTLIEKEKLPMPDVDIEIQSLVLDLLTTNKIEFYSSINKLRFSFADDKILTASLNGYTREFDLVLLSIGVEPNNALAISSKLQVGKFGGLTVDSKLKTSDPNIYAAGDNIEVQNKITGRCDFLPFATYAQQMGHIAGENAAGGNSIAKPIVKNVAVNMFNKNLVVVGLNSVEAFKHNFDFTEVNGIAQNLVKVMPDSEKVFGKLLIEKSSKKIIGASFFGGKEAAGYGDLISTFIQNNIKATELAKINFNYSPPVSPFINLLSILGRKAEKELL